MDRMKVAVIGPVCKDVVMMDGKVSAKPGGLVYYAGNALASLGADVRAYASCGPQDSWLYSHLRTPQVVPVPAEGTLAFINEYPDSSDPDRRVQRVEEHPNPLASDMIPLDGLKGFGRVILGPLMHGNVAPAFVRELSEAGHEVILSPQGMIRYCKDGAVFWDRPEEALEALPFVDYLFLDAAEARFISGEPDVGAAALALRNAGAKSIVVTDGMNGSCVLADDGAYQVRAFPPISLADPTGAGDTYLAGFVAALDIFSEPVERGEFAAMTATMAMETGRPFDGSVGDVMRRLGKP